MSETLEITPQEAKQRLSDPNTAFLVDVREPEEFSAARIAEAYLIPMRDIPAELQWLDGIAESRTLLILCHHGVRSLQVAAWLREKGIDDCYSIAGGIDRWSREVDGSVPLY